MQASTARKVAGTLIALTALLGVIILGSDNILWQSMSGAHAYALIGFVIVDFVVAAYVIAEADRMAFTVAAAWSALRIVAQLANVYSAVQIGLTYAQFATYLFNPMVLQPGNPPGVPAALLDMILILEAVTFGVSWKGRSPTQAR